MKEERALRRVPIKPVAGAAKGLGREELLLFRPVLGIGVILADMLGSTELLDLPHPVGLFLVRVHRLPVINLVAPDQLDSVVTLDVAVRFLLPVVVVIRDDVSVMSAPSDFRRQTRIEHFERPPRPPHEFHSAGDQFTPCRHAREASDEVIVEDLGPRGKAVNVRCSARALGIVSAKAMAGQAINQHENDVHWHTLGALTEV